MKYTYKNSESLCKSDQDKVYYKLTIKQTNGYQPNVCSPLTPRYIDKLSLCQMP